MYSLYLQLNIHPSVELWDLVTGILYQFHTQGIDEGEETDDIGKLVEADEFDAANKVKKLTPPQEFKAYFKNLRDLENALRALQPHLDPHKPKVTISQDSDDHEKYHELWKKNFKPLMIGNFCIRASWHKPEKKTKAVNKNLKNKIIEVILDPGMAFGTGTHFTTQHCLEFISHLAQEKKSKVKKMTALDFGCGSGILAIAMKKSGFLKVTAVDIDPLAIEASKRNSKQNKVKIDVALKIGKKTKFDLIVANILKNTLIEYAHFFKEHLKKGGRLILSGLLKEQEKEILIQYKTYGFTCTQRMESDGWVSLLF